MAFPHLGREMVPGVEPQMAARARTEQKDTFYFETLAEFDQRTQAVSDQQYGEEFFSLVQGFRGFQRVVNEMYASWLSGQIEHVEAVLPRTILGLPHVSKLILDDTNEAWLAKLLAALEKPERTLIVVGAARLPRPLGLLAHLRRAGRMVRLVPDHLKAA
jgi:uncharacterized protein YbaP (TraB family)